jgi:hypothetical protein
MHQNRPLPPDLAVRILRAKVAELEARVTTTDDPSDIDWLAVDLALVADLLADAIARGLQ